jgi:hypothetical protein
MIYGGRVQLGRGAVPSRAISLLGSTLALLGGGCSMDSSPPGTTGDRVAVTAQALTPPDTLCTSADSGGKKYWFCANDRSWQTARTKCQALGSEFDLAAIQSAAENEFIRSHLLVDGWVGGTDSAAEGAWRWASNGVQFWQGASSGSAVGGAYTNWKLGQPNNTVNQDCLLLEDDFGGKWQDESCASTRDYVCEGDGCPSDPNKTEAGQCGCGVADTDSDGDGSANCVDQCPSDASKTAPGACGCGVAETDSDFDGTPNCRDQCPNDNARIEPGDCGCANAPQPAGTACDDGLCSANTTCNGAGSCGDPQDCAPSTLCAYNTHGGHVYWFCANARTWPQARDLCRAKDMELAQIIDEDENAFVYENIGTSVWIGGNDRGVEGRWRWATSPSDEGLRFWQGGASGALVPGSFAAWASGEPGIGSSQADCAKMGVLDGNAWRDTSCSDTLGFVCEQPGDLCPDDVNKRVPGQCGCGVADTDADQDGTPNCRDQCPQDPLRTVPGDCGCVGHAGPAPAGTACDDGVCPANAQCDGAGRCGSLQQCRPHSSCTSVAYGGRVYWYCSHPKTWSSASDTCSALPRTTLLQVDSQYETELTDANTASELWAGGNDVAVEGQWVWDGSEQRFWNGTHSGQPVPGAYSNWRIGEPNALAAQDCLQIEPNGEWEDEGCLLLLPFACETCLPKSCAMAGAECGTMDDGCGGTVNCGTCSGSEVCFEAANQCSDPSGDACRAAIEPDVSLPAEEAAYEYHEDLAACAGEDVDECVAHWFGQTMLDATMAASMCVSGRITPAMHNTINADRDTKTMTMYGDPTYACRVRDGDADRDLVPDDIDQCRDTPSLAPTNAQGCSVSTLLPGPEPDELEELHEHTVFPRDPECDGIGIPHTPAPTVLDQFTAGVKVFLLFDMNNLAPNEPPPGCDLYYEIKGSVRLSDGSTENYHLGFSYAERLPFGSHAPAVPVSVMFRIRSTDPGDRGAWAAAQAADTLYSVRAIYGNGRASGWSAVVRAGREPWPVF